MGYHIAHLGTYLYVNVKLCQTHTNTGGTLNMTALFHFYLLCYILSTLSTVLDIMQLDMWELYNLLML